MNENDINEEINSRLNSGYTWQECRTCRVWGVHYPFILRSKQKPKIFFVSGRDQMCIVS
jgi:hypothetical protein